MFLKHGTDSFEELNTEPP